MGAHHAGNKTWIHVVDLKDDGARFPRVLTKCDRVVPIGMTTKGRGRPDEDATCPDCNPFDPTEMT
jgi:hypothetical protein